MNLGKITATYIEHMGSDLSVVNAARASFAKTSDWADAATKTLKDGDAKLIRFLATGYRTSEWDALIGDIRDAALIGNEPGLTRILKAYKRRAQHWAPFGHPHCTIRITVPIFLARQFVKHQVGGVWSEESRRYIDSEPDVWMSDEWHTRPDDIKQGSGELAADQDGITAHVHSALQAANATYLHLTKVDRVAPEEARIVLPLATMTTVVWTGSLLFWSRVVNQRVDDHAQLAAQELARQISKIMQPLYPVSWKELTQ